MRRFYFLMCVIGTVIPGHFSEHFLQLMVWTSYSFSKAYLPTALQEAFLRMC